MNPLRIAVVGMGKMGLVHASILSSMPNVEIVGLCEKSRVLRRMVKPLFKSAQAVDDLEKLSDLNLNAVYVTTPIPTHFSIIRTLFSQRISENIFVEKTLTTDSEKANGLCILPQTLEGVTMVGYMKRFAVTFAKAKQILAENILGKTVSFDAYAYSSDFLGVKSGSLKTGSRGGVLSDLGSHVIDLALWFFGDFQVEAASLISIIGGTWEDAANFEVKKSGLRGHFRTSWCMENYRLPSFGLTVKGDKGKMVVDDYSVRLELKDCSPRNWFRHDLDDHVAFLLGESEYYREDEAFVNAVLSGSPIQPDFATASQVDSVIDQVKKRGKKNGS